MSCTISCSHRLTNNSVLGNILETLRFNVYAKYTDSPHNSVYFAYNRLVDRLII